MAQPTGSKTTAASLAKTLVLLIALSGVAAFGVSRDRLAGVRGFNPDEFEHLHFSWLTSQGQVAYRDYFDHHPPCSTSPSRAGWSAAASTTGRDRPGPWPTGAP